jgi:hypothetical protein
MAPTTKAAAPHPPATLYVDALFDLVLSHIARRVPVTDDPDRVVDMLVDEQPWLADRAAVRRLAVASVAVYLDLGRAVNARHITSRTEPR